MPNKKKMCKSDNNIKYCSEIRYLKIFKVTKIKPKCGLDIRSFIRNISILLFEYPLYGYFYLIVIFLILRTNFTINIWTNTQC